MKSDKKTESTGYWMTRDNRGNRYCDLPVATKHPDGLKVGDPGSRTRLALRKRYAALLEAKSIADTGFKAWLRGQA